MSCISDPKHQSGFDSMGASNETLQPELSQIQVTEDVEQQKASRDVILMPPPTWIPQKRKEPEVVTAIVPGSFGHFGKSWCTPEESPQDKTMYGLTVGNVVRWTKSDDDVPEGAHGFVIGFKEERVQVSFARGTFLFKPIYLFRVDKVQMFGFSLGDVVRLGEGQKDPLGEVLGYIPRSHMVRVRFPNGTANFRVRELSRIARDERYGLVIGDTVGWTSVDEDVPENAQGKVASFQDDRVCVHFPRGTWSFQPGELVSLGHARFGFAIGELVQWLDCDADIRLGARGEVVGFISERQLVRVRFANGYFNFLPSRLVRVNEAKVYGFSLGDIVQWRQVDADVPRGARGTVIGFALKRVRVNFPKGSWTFRPRELIVQPP